MSCANLILSEYFQAISRVTFGGSRSETITQRSFIYPLLTIYGQKNPWPNRNVLLWSTWHRCQLNQIINIEINMQGTYCYWHYYFRQTINDLSWHDCACLNMFGLNLAERPFSIARRHCFIRDLWHIIVVTIGNKTLSWLVQRYQSKLLKCIMKFARKETKYEKKNKNKNKRK